MAQEIAFATPRAEEMTKTVVGVGVALATGLAQGLAAKIAPQFGVVSPILTWGTLLVAPVVGAFGALFTRGMLGDAFFGMAAGGSGALGYCVPGLLPELGLAKSPGDGQGGGIKLLGQGASLAAQRQQALARQALGSWAYTPEEARGVVGQGHTVRDFA